MNAHKQMNKFIRVNDSANKEKYEWTNNSVADALASTTDEKVGRPRRKS